MSQYRKKPVVIEAVQWRARNGEEVAKHMGLASDADLQFDETGLGIQIVTPEGIMLAIPNDFIIRGIKGELYPCRQDIFNLTYEAVDRE